MAKNAPFGMVMIILFTKKTSVITGFKVFGISVVSATKTSWCFLPHLSSSASAHSAEEYSINRDRKRKKKSPFLNKAPENGVLLDTFIV